MSPGWNFTRELDVTNRNRYPVEMSYVIGGKVSDYVSVTSVPVKVIEPKETVTLNLTASIPETGVVSGEYGGNITIKLTPYEQ